MPKPVATEPHLPHMNIVTIIGGVSRDGESSRQREQRALR